MVFNSSASFDWSTNVPYSTHFYQHSLKDSVHYLLSFEIKKFLSQKVLQASVHLTLLCKSVQALEDDLGAAEG